MPHPTPPFPYPYPYPRRSGAGAVVAAAFVGVWVVGVTAVLQALGWLVDQALLIEGIDVPWWLWPVVNLLGATLVAVPALLLALIPRAPAVRATGRAWLAGASAVALLGVARAVPAPQHEAHLALVALGALTLAALWRQPRRPPARWSTAGTAAPPARDAPPATGERTRGDGERTRGTGGALAVAAGLLVLLPWLWLGALGGAVESLLALAGAAALGRLGGVLLGGGFWAPFRTSRARLVGAGGAVAGVTLALVAAGAGASGAQLPLLLVLPPLGFTAAALAAAGDRRAVPVLVGLAALGPLAFIDPEEVSLLLAEGREVPFWVMIAAGCSLLLALLVGLGYALTLLAPRSARPRPWRPVTTATVAGVVAVAAVGVYAGLGQPGLYGERLFVVMSDQADLSGLPAGTGQAGRDARAAEVYRRLVAHAEASQADLRADLDRLRLPYTPYYLVNAVEVAGGPAVRAWLSRRDDVDRVLLSQQLRPLPATGPAAGGSAPAPRTPLWNITLVGADRVWAELGVTGEGIVVGTSDSGVDGAHPALAGRFRGGDDSWYDPWHGTTTPTDRNGHGTHTLGSAIGAGGIGVAPGAHWTGCTNLDRNLGNPARYLDCLQFMLAPFPSDGDPWRDGRPERAPHVLTNSWGCPPIEGCDATALRPATAALHAAGIYVVVAAGNTGPSCGSIEDAPAPYPDVLTVGAVERDGEVAVFSSRGPVDGADKPDLVAPGDGVLSAMPGGGYAVLDGTSMATPHVAGVVALMWSANPSLIGDVDATTAILRDTARPVAATEPECGGPQSLAGAGLVDARAAVAAALATAG